MTYAIRFDFPEGEMYAGLHNGAAGWAPALTTAQLFTDADEAVRYLENAYGPSSKWGKVVTVGDRGPA